MTLNWKAPLSVPLIRRKLTLDDLHTLRLSGVVGDTERVELINGELVLPPGQGTAADQCCERLGQQLRGQLLAEAQLSIAPTVRLSGFDAAVPDLVVSRKARQQAVVEGGDVQLIVEITQGPHAYTDILKPNLYAAYEIPDYWLIDVSVGTVRVHRGIAAARRYSVQEIVPTGGTLTPLFNPSLRLDLKDFVVISK